MIATWGQPAYEEDVIKGRFFLRNSFILNQPDAIRHVLVDNYENYTRTPAASPFSAPWWGAGLLPAKGHPWPVHRPPLTPPLPPASPATPSALRGPARAGRGPSAPPPRAPRARRLPPGASRRGAIASGPRPPPGRPAAPPGRSPPGPRR